MLVRDAVAALESLAPLRLAASWDNVGLLAGDPDAAVTRVLAAIDLTADVAREAEREGCDLIVAYHPPIFQPLKRVLAGTPVYETVRRGAAIFSPHTALDVAEGGTSDVLADAAGMGKARGPLRAADERPAKTIKLVVFVPAEAVARVSEALFAAGAGRIGDYSSCSFRASGQGTFFGEAGTNPRVGERGRLEVVDELRLETVVPLARVAEVVAALRASHPYEEPAFDLVRLATPPEAAGIGRVGPIDRAPRLEVVSRIKRALGLAHVLVAGPTEGDASRVAVCPGACGDLLDAAIQQGADVYLTGELRHHDALRAAARGLTVVCTLHSASERAGLGRFVARAAERLPGLPFVTSRADAEPFAVR